MDRSSGWFVDSPGRDVSPVFVRSTRVRRWWSDVRRTGGFRTVELNAVGWFVVVAPGAAVGAVIGHVRHRRLVYPVVGGVGAWAVALFVDRGRWRGSRVTIDVTGLDDSEWLVAQQELVRRGVAFDDARFRNDDGDERHEVRSTMRHLREILEVVHGS